MCKVCEEVMKNGEYVVDGAWTRLKIEKHKDKFHILAIGEGMADMEIKYCPFCGKRLGKEEEEGIGFVIEMIKDSSEELEELKHKNQFCRGAAFAYRCVLGMLRNEGWIEDETN